MEGAIITYEMLYDTLRKEKNNMELQELEKELYGKITKYLNEKEDILKSQEGKKSIFTSTEVQKTRKQIENVQKIIKELYELREQKIVKVARIASKTNNHSNHKETMINEEKDLYDEITYTLNNYRENILKNLLDGKNIISKTNKNKTKDLKNTNLPSKLTKNIKFIMEIPSFVGNDLEEYGPFEKEDSMEIPLEIANLLIKSGKAIEDENT